MNPRIEINYRKLVHNTEVLQEKAKEHGIELAAVTKCFCGIPEIAQGYVDGGVKYLADSRISNIKKLQELPNPKILLRLPMLTEVHETVAFADISLNSEIETIRALNREAKILGVNHRVILMADLGDLREGVFEEEELILVAKEVEALSNIILHGIGVNLTCYGGVIPSVKNLSKLEYLGNAIEKEIGRSLEIYSGGNSSSIYLLDEKSIPERINHLRLGEAIVLGTESAYGKNIENTHQDIFQLVGEVIELKEKPSMPIGEIGMDAFGNTPSFEDEGIRKRAILAVGRQDFGSYDIFPVKEGMKILGASSDHLILDVTDAKGDVAVGDEIRFNLRYGALLSLMTSEYITKKIIY
ncbi:ornithine racemase Orr [Isachenkonia alkalipeptolytica]|uniref:Alanine/ornithine racemase family PLP-dependent enzyme n=1 Tax=Isachenkonia alkalipeptolytica TaxID=2565777 RepID=A0AA43XML7_9CLOT|nr:ornithine racemase Orr [Isachenkonia alkalipeptolytica]NBG88730.1 alanine/ornithine racemase family PLP-dependent enzyme [Isachenkonia alkalipeptolytica]